MSTSSNLAATETDPSIRHLLDLPHDNLLAILCASSRASLGALACCNHMLCHAVGNEGLPWQVALSRDFDLHLTCTSSSLARAEYRALCEALEAQGAVELDVAGILTDGGLDGEVGGGLRSLEAGLRLEECELRTWSVSPDVRRFWVANAFEADSSCYSSDVAADGGAAANVTLVGRIKGRVAESKSQKRAAAARRFEFLVERVGPLLNEDAAQSDPGLLDMVLLELWAQPNARALLLQDLQGRARHEASIRLEQEYGTVLQEHTANSRAFRLNVTRQLGRTLLVDESNSATLLPPVPPPVAAAPEPTQPPALQTCVDPCVCAAGVLAVVMRLELRRGLSCTCPTQVRLIA